MSGPLINLENLGDKIEGLLSENILSKVSVDCYFNLAFQHLRQDGSINAWMQFVAYGWRMMHRGCSKIAIFWITLYNPQLQLLL
ncbi:hypothetical protein L3X38_014668 [Prunus dulcis]|uniref:Uncharacterized protein n=1 Tax=Prunus dulcis TaxID=3755 RepID=A0AAD4WQ97_PRUDU|nr:hypothetical protein L3X38_014668 [Prunus dulcis]